MGNVGQTRGRTGNGSRWGLGLSRGFFHSLPRARKQMEKYKIYSGGKKPAESPKPPCAALRCGPPAQRENAAGKSSEAMAQIFGSHFASAHTRENLARSFASRIIVFRGL